MQAKIAQPLTKRSRVSEVSFERSIPRPRHVRLAGCVCCFVPRVVEASHAVGFGVIPRRSLHMHPSPTRGPHGPAFRLLLPPSSDARDAHTLYFTRPKAATGRRGLALAVALKNRRLRPPSSLLSPHSGPSLTKYHRPSVSASLSCLPAPFPISLSLSFPHSSLVGRASLLRLLSLPPESCPPNRVPPPRPSSPVSYPVAFVSWSPYTSLAPGEFRSSVASPCPPHLSSSE